MNCIDAVEGALKATITRMHHLCEQDNQDATQFIRSIEAVIESAHTFMEDHPEITPSPAVLQQVLYDFAKKLWITEQVSPSTSSENSSVDADLADYYGYCFDYLYANGVYPP